MSRESFPELPEMPEQIGEIPYGLLSSLISRTGFAISMEESRFTLNGALLLLKPEGVTMVSTDGHRLAYVDQPFLNGATSQFPCASAAQSDERDVETGGGRRSGAESDPGRR